MIVPALVVAGALFVIVFGVAPYVAQALLNRVHREGPRELSEEARVIHTTLRVADMHADTLMWKRNILRRNRVGHIDLPRLQAGGVGLQVFAAATLFPGNTSYHGKTYNYDLIPLLALAQHWPVATWTSLQERALYSAEKLHDFALRSNDTLRIIRSRADLADLWQRRAADPDTVGALLAIEGGHCLEGDLDNVDFFFHAGFRMMSLTHFSDNRLGGSSNGLVRGGLTSFGARVIERMERLGMILDLAHASPRLIEDVFDVATRPFVVSHTGCRKLVEDPRNLTDHHLRRIAARDGLIGIGFWPVATGGDGIEAIAEALRHAADVVGIERVALGSDFDGAVTTPLDASEMAFLTGALLDEDFDEPAIRAIMGENLIAFLEKNLPAD